VPPLPLPLPPAERPVGQLVGESIKLYGRRFWRALALGFPPALWAALPTLFDDTPLFLFTPLLGAPLLALSFVGAIALAATGPIRVAPALLAATLIFVPFQFLLVFFVLPALVWFASVGLAVPVLAQEEVGFGTAFRRAFTLARADFVHALGSLAALTIVAFVSATLMAFLLRDFGDQARTAAVVIAAVVISPLFFLGCALLYFDQVAREDRKRVSRR
jgi:hypothetical protein